VIFGKFYFTLYYKVLLNYPSTEVFKRIAMTQSNLSATQPLHTATIGKSALRGAAIAYVLITLFLLVPGVATNPAWPTFWTMRPLLIVPLAGALGGICYHFLKPVREQGGWKKIAANVVGLVVYIIALWLGTVLGLAGTLWD